MSLPWLKTLQDTPWLPDHLKAILHEIQSYDEEDFQNTVHDVIADRWQNLSTGVLKYMHHPYQRPKLEASVCFELGSMRVWDYAPDSQNPIVLVIPSLINKAYILDLTHERSFMRYLCAQNYRPWLVEWQNPLEEEQNFDVADYIISRLLPLLTHAHTYTSPLAIVGYCMGGTMSMALTQIAQSHLPDVVSRLVLIATPWNFHAQPDLTPQNWWLPPDEKLHPQWHAFLKTSQLPALPPEHIQMFFQTLTPQAALRKFDAFADMDPTEDAAHFIAVEEWINDGIAMTMPVAYECFYGWGIENRLHAGKWIVQNQPIRPDALHTPTLVVIPEHDHIVPPYSSQPLVEHIVKVQHVTIPLSHVGIIISSKAPTLSWAGIVRFLESMTSYK